MRPALRALHDGVEPQRASAAAAPAAQQAAGPAARHQRAHEPPVVAQLLDEARHLVGDLPRVVQLKVEARAHERAQPARRLVVALQQDGDDLLALLEGVLGLRAARLALLVPARGGGGGGCARTCCRCWWWSCWGVRACVRAGGRGVRAHYETGNARVCAGLCVCLRGASPKRKSAPGRSYGSAAPPV